MAQYKALIKFKDIEEDKIYEPNDEFEMTVKRADELQKNIDEKYKGKFGDVLERLDKPETNNKDDEEAK